MTRCRAWFWHPAGCLFCYGLIVLAWLMIRCGVAPAEWLDQESADTKQAA
jgi:hypothetical protein